MERQKVEWFKKNFTVLDGWTRSGICRFLSLKMLCDFD